MVFLYISFSVDIDSRHAVAFLLSKNYIIALYSPRLLDAQIRFAWMYCYSDSICPSCRLLRNSVNFDAPLEIQMAPSTFSAKPRINWADQSFFYCVCVCVCFK